MKKAVIVGERKAAIVEVPTPRAINDWALIKVHATPMCTEYKAFLAGEKRDCLGHEAAGEVVEVVQPGHVQVGDRVVVMPFYSCGQCELCISGDYIHCQHYYNYEEYTGQKEGNAPYAQYLVKPSWLLQKIPDGVSYEKASLACCGLGPTFGACEALGVTAFDTVLVTGLGPVGLGAVVNARYRGARVIAMDSVEYRANLALELGAEAVIDPRDPQALQKIKDRCGGVGPDCAIDCSGIVAAHRLCIDATRRKGRIAFVGECHEDTPLRVSNDMIRKGLTIMGVWHYKLSDFPKIMKMIQESPLVEKLISHNLPMSQIQEAFEISASPDHAKIILNPWA